MEGITEVYVGIAGEELYSTLLYLSKVPRQMTR
jgi:hypothetical protein